MLIHVRRLRAQYAGSIDQMSTCSNRSRWQKIRVGLGARSNPSRNYSSKQLQIPCWPMLKRLSKLFVHCLLSNHLETTESHYKSSVPPQQHNQNPLETSPKLFWTIRSLAYLSPMAPCLSSCPRSIPLQCRWTVTLDVTSGRPTCGVALSDTNTNVLFQHGTQLFSDPTT